MLVYGFFSVLSIIIENSFAWVSFGNPIKSISKHIDLSIDFDW